MERLLEGVNLHGVTREGVKERGQKLEERLLDDYGVSAMSDNHPGRMDIQAPGSRIFENRVRYAPEYRGKSQDPNRIIEAAVGAGQTAVSEEGVEILKGIGEQIEEAIAESKAACRALEEEYSRLNDEEGMSPGARRYSQDIPEL